MISVTEEKAGKSWWMWVPVGLLLASTVGVGSLAMIAIRDPNFALESDYYDKALHWDRTQAQAADNRRLGYRVEVASRITADAQGNATLSVRIVDASGSAASGAIVRGTAFANAFASEVRTLDLQPAGPGIYSTPLNAQHFGLWEFRLVVKSGSDQVTSTLRSDVLRGAG